MRLAYHFLNNIQIFSSVVIKRRLRLYQLEPALAIIHSILYGEGRTFAVMMSRQAGKNELSGQMEAYLMNMYRRVGGQIVKTSPTFKPQTINSILRLTDRLENHWNKGRWRRREGYIVELFKARTLFFSADPHANVVGGTADVLLECDEAQDVKEEKWTKDFEPMGASTNVTTVLWGTAWTSDTFLARTCAYLQQQQAKDGVRRVFKYGADWVGEEVPAYRDYVKSRVARLGRQHPLIKTQYFLEEIDAEGRLFPKARRALMYGQHPRRHDPIPGHRYALLIDVAGEEEAEGDALDRAMLENPRRDATALTVVDVDFDYGELPTYRVVDRKLWLGTRHSSLYGQLLALQRHWGATWVVVDSTGVGAGLASFLARALPDKVIPVQFSPKVKSDLGWNFVGVVDTGRFLDYYEPNPEPDTRQYRYELENCQYLIRSGPAKMISWGVWESPAYDGLVARGHDDLLISAALCSVLDEQPWVRAGPSAVVETQDTLDEIDRAEW
jgi:hypothetical protein